MRRKTLLPLVAITLLGVVACGPAEVVVTVATDAPSPDGDGMVTRPLQDIEVQLLPFDRDAIFDSLTQAYGEPEPPIPDELLQAREEVRVAQEQWQAADARWSTIRDTLQKISATMEDYNPAEARYVVLFREFQDFETELGRIERERDSLFQRFNELQRGTIRASDSIRILQENWADEAFAGVGDAFIAAQRVSGLQAAADTTGADGIARFQARPGQYWLYARYPLTFTELYWNVGPIDVQRGDPVEVRLTRENAQVRQKL